MAPTLTSSIIFSWVKDYIRLHRELRARLSKFPDDWHKYQNIFNATLDKVYADILEFEKENINKSEAKIYKLKKIFERRYQKYFLEGEYIRWSFQKPYGYAGDFKIIDDIYQNLPQAGGLTRLWDNWFLQLATCVSVRERKEDFKKIISDFVKKQNRKNIRIMSLASGPAREIKELLETDSQKLFAEVTFDCYDLDMHALEYARQLINNRTNVNFFQKNAIRMAFKKNITEEIPAQYGLIYSTGLFDYLDENMAIKLVKNLIKLLRPDGIMAISNARDKYSNSSASWMEWVVDWFLIYRTQDEFKKIFLDAGIPEKRIKIIPQQQSKVMQYCIVE